MRKLGSRCARVLLPCLAVLLPSCGAKTGLLIPDASRPPDSGMDAGIDAGICMPRPLELMRRGAQVMFVIDRSNSMADTLDGRDPSPGEARRWDIAADALGAVLSDADPLLEFGGKFYPRFSSTDPETPEEACAVEMGIDLIPGPSNVAPLLDFFRRTDPQGGTPTASALETVRDYFLRRPTPGLPRFVVLVTDGGPNCNPDTGVHHTMCTCTGEPVTCLHDVFGPYNCLDYDRTLDVVRSLATAEIPVYVIGIDDPTRPDLASVLDDMAVAGGRPREVPGEHRFYSVRSPTDLQGALMTITDSIARCVFRLTPQPPPGSTVEVRIGDVIIARDPGRTEGWDFINAERSELTLFGGACERATQSEEDVHARLECPEEE